MHAWRLDGKPRTARQFSVYQNCPLPTPEDRLFFILTYLKTYALQVVQGRLFGMRREYGDAGDNQRTSIEGPASFPRRSNPEEPRHAGETRHGGPGDAQRGIIPRFSMHSPSTGLWQVHERLEIPIHHRLASLLGRVGNGLIA